MGQRFGGLFAAAMALGNFGCVDRHASDVTDALLVTPPKGEWLSYGRDSAEQRFSPLTQINVRSVAKLGLAWRSDLDTARGQEATPLMHAGVLYVSTAWSMVKAYDARTGRLLWSYDPKVPRVSLAHSCCDAVNRGVALYRDKVFVATLDGRLVALEQRTGKAVWIATVAPNQTDYAITGAPRVANGLVVIGAGGGEFKGRGFLAAFEADTGKEKWRFHTVPGNPANGFENNAMEMAAKTWTGEWWKLGGGGAVWDSITYDPSTNLVLFGTGNAEPWNPGPTGRTGDSLFTASIVAVDADTGEYRWHFKETPEDRWDFDSDAQITVTDLRIKGEKRHVALHAPKNGYFYVIDVKSGKFISAGSFAPQNWTTGIDPLNGRPKINPEARYEQTGKIFVTQPSAPGAHNWQPMSFSSNTGLVYIPVNQLSFPYGAETGWKPSKMGTQIALGASEIPAGKASRAQVSAAVTGALIAWDPVAQKEVWRHAYPSAWNGGTLATAGNLVFEGDAQGNFHAYDAQSGKPLWSYPVQSGIMAAPMTYEIGGEQYVAVLTGFGGSWDTAAGLLSHPNDATRNISRLLVFKLDGEAKLPPPPPINQMPLNPPAYRGSARQAKHGAYLFNRYCAVCHGYGVISGGLNPDLRRSAVISNAAALRNVVIDGALQSQGMASFQSDLGSSDVEDIRQYIIKRANEDKILGER